MVIDLLNDTPAGASIYFDNFFTSVSLLQQLTIKQLRATGTMCLNTVGDYPFGEKKELMKKPQALMVSATMNDSVLTICL